MLAEPREAHSRKSTFTLTASTPAKIDLSTTYQFGNVEVQLQTNAIYKIDGDVLTYCVASPDQARPTEFATSADDGNTLVVLKRFTKQK